MTIPRSFSADKPDLPVPPVTLHEAGGGADSVVQDDSDQFGVGAKQPAKPSPKPIRSSSRPTFFGIPLCFLRGYGSALNLWPSGLDRSPVGSATSLEDAWETVTEAIAAAFEDLKLEAEEGSAEATSKGQSGDTDGRE